MNRRSLLKLLPKVGIGALFAGWGFFKDEPVEAVEAVFLPLDNMDDSLFANASSSTMAHSWMTVKHACAGAYAVEKRSDKYYVWDRDQVLIGCKDEKTIRSSAGHERIGETSNSTISI